MRRALTFLLVLSSGPVHAQQDCTSAPGCIQRWVGPVKIPTEAVLAAGVIAAPIILAGGFVTAVKTASAERGEPAGVKREPRKPPELALIPTTPPPPPPGHVPTPEERAKQEQLVRVNDALTNAAIAVGGAAVIGGIIYGIVKKK
jgi:hypothetical protein